MAAAAARPGRKLGPWGWGDGFADQDVGPVGYAGLDELLVYRADEASAVNSRNAANPGRRSRPHRGRGR